MSHWTRKFKVLGACDDAVAWAKNYDSLEAAWAACDRGDWMLWLVGRTSASEPWSDARKPLVACCVEVAREVLPIYEAQYPDDSTVRDCLDLFARWASGEQIARDALVAARRKCYAADADAADAAADAAYAAGAAGAAGAADAVRTQSLKRSVEIVRKHFPSPPAVVPA